ncbi:MAG: hypothetical protein NTY09_05575 [bacterium]|nr:hypothetical protein [bacterium]
MSNLDLIQFIESLKKVMKDGNDENDILLPFISADWRGELTWNGKPIPEAMEDILGEFTYDLDMIICMPNWSDSRSDFYDERLVTHIKDFFENLKKLGFPV